MRKRIVIRKSMVAACWGAGMAQTAMGQLVVNATGQQSQCGGQQEPRVLSSLPGERAGTGATMARGGPSGDESAAACCPCIAYTASGIWLAREQRSRLAFKNGCWLLAAAAGTSNSPQW